MKKILLTSCVAIMLLSGSSHAVTNKAPMLKPQVKVDLLGTLPPPKIIEVPTEVIEVKEQKSYSDEDIYWLSRIVSSEARGESLEGQIAVANVVLNRCNKFHMSIKQVIFAKGQFQPVQNGSIYDNPTESATEASVKALEGEKVVDDDVIYFYAPSRISSRHSITKTKIHKKIGNHIFSK